MALSLYVSKCKSQPQPVISYDAVLLSNFVIPPAMKNDLAQHIKTFSYLFHGLTLDKSKQVAYEFATRNKLKVPCFWMKRSMALMALIATYVRNEVKP